MKLIARGLTLLAMLATVQCGSSTSPTNPNSTMNVVLGASSVPAGATTQGTVSLNAPQTGSVNIALSSSNPALATVPGTVTIQAGSSRATFTVTAVAPGTATILATLTRRSVQSAPPTA